MKKDGVRKSEGFVIIEISLQSITTHKEVNQMDVSTHEETNNNKKQREGVGENQKEEFFSVHLQEKVCELEKELNSVITGRIHNQ